MSFLRFYGALNETEKKLLHERDWSENSDKQT